MAGYHSVQSGIKNIANLVYVETYKEGPRIQTTIFYNLSNFREALKENNFSLLWKFQANTFTGIIAAYQQECGNVNFYVTNNFAESIFTPHAALSSFI